MTKKPRGKQSIKNGLCARSAAALAIASVLKSERSLTAQFDSLSKRLQTQDTPLFKALCFGVTRHYRSLSALATPLLEKKLRQKDQDIYALLLIGIYQLDALRVPAYAAVDSCVKASLILKKNWAKGFLNATLRNFQKQAEQSKARLSDTDLTEHPDWLLQRIQQTFATQAHAIITANNNEPPLCIRVNQQRMPAADYLALLNEANIPASLSTQSDAAIYIHDKSVAIETLPAFNEGAFSVQDEAAQIACEQLSLMDGQRILDACAAPGGKTCHMLERASNLSVLAVDHDQQRLSRIQQNLDRLHLSAKIICADITDIDNWWDGQLFDRILCDVPCSATGVIRRHPDIKLLRRNEDIDKLANLQLQILTTLWQCLKPGGILLYTTCSILPEENNWVIKAFLDSQKDCEPLELDMSPTLNQVKTPVGVQLLPEINSHDGFYYAKLIKGMHQAIK